MLDFATCHTMSLQLPEGPALDNGCAFIDDNLHKNFGILLCSQPSVGPVSVLAAAYLCRAGMPLDHACRLVSTGKCVCVRVF